jgi:hypothetical protein
MLQSYAVNQPMHSSGEVTVFDMRFYNIHEAWNQFGDSISR